MPLNTLNDPLFPEWEKAHFADYVRILRGPYSVRELATILGVTHAAVTQWETGDCVPRPEVLRKLLKHYQDWSITQGLGEAATRANRDLAQKIRLTRRSTRGKPPATYTRTEQ